MLAPCLTDEEEVIKNVKNLLDVQEQLRQAENKNKEIREYAEIKTNSLLAEIANLKNELINEKEESDRKYQMMLIKVNVAEEKAKSQQRQNFILATFDRLLKKRLPEKEPTTRIGKLIGKIHI